MSSLPDKNWEDDELLEAFRHAETKEKAFTQLIKKYQERLYWHIRRMIADHDDTNDILQNALIKIWKNLDKFREHSTLFTWLYRIATNETLSWIDRKKRRGTISISDNENIFAEKLVAQKGFDANKLEWKLQLAIQSLPEKQKIVFNLRYYDEMPYDQMSDILETSEGALKASYHHAVKKVEEFIKKES